jgi:cyclopropane-fatty-acyl-phospholipid synthase
LAANTVVTMLRHRLLDLALERGLLPDPVLRAGSRWGAIARRRREARGGVAAQEERLRALVRRMSTGPVAEQVQAANDQHYELPPAFFGLFLGPRRKYSGCLFPSPTTDLAAAEEAMLALTCERAQIADGMDVLDLGCGWGALSLWIAERFPACRVVAVSNSHAQRAWIEAERDRRGLTERLTVHTADVNAFDPGRTFDRVVSVEMFEHLRNWAELLRRIASWLEPDGRLFVHVFSHRTLPYRFEGTWAAERFFTAGTMPSHELLGFFQRDLVLEERWAVPGTHYARTLAAWLERLDANAGEALAILRTATGSGREARRLLATWRLFLISTREIWGWRDGDEWLVSHYRLAPRGGSGTKPEVRSTYSA